MIDLDLETAESLSTDVLVIGGGAAGLRAAIEASRRGVDVTLLSESPVGLRNNSAISAGLLAGSGVGEEPGDSAQLHVLDSMDAGRFINDPGMLALMAEGASRQVRDLTEFGVEFRRRAGGELLLTQLPGHSHARHVAGARFRGIDLTVPMRDHAIGAGVRFIEGFLVTGLLRVGDVVAGALAVGRGRLLLVQAASTILATGGAGQLYLRTNNSLGMTGDGYALAYRAGAVLRDMEFVQFYPTAWGRNGGKMCFYERFLPVGAVLRNSNGEDVPVRHGMARFSDATRDRVTRAIMEEVADGRGVESCCVVLDFTSMPEDEAQKLLKAGLMSPGFHGARLPVGPSAHFFMGGVEVNEEGETSVVGLYAAGEVCGGCHGANRLGGNAITETLVFGGIAGESAAARVLREPARRAPQPDVAGEIDRLKACASGARDIRLEELEQSLKHVMWDGVGVIREADGLGKAEHEIAALREELGGVSLADARELPRAVKLDNMLTVAGMLCRAALTRTESRGAHYRADYPEEDDDRWLKTIEVRSLNGGISLALRPVGRAGWVSSDTGRDGSE